MPIQVAVSNNNTIRVGIVQQNQTVPVGVSSNNSITASAYTANVVNVGFRDISGINIERRIETADDVSLNNLQDKQFLVYNTSVQKWVNVSANLFGGTVNQILVKKSASDYDYQWEDMIIELPQTTFTKLIDEASSTITYLGEADPNSIESDPVWRIQRIVFDAGGSVDEVRYAGTGAFDQIWNNRAALTYI